MKTAELVGAQLDWAVAKCEGHPTVVEGGRLWLASDRGNRIPGEYQPSTKWAQGGPIIEREKLGVGHSWDRDYWLASAHGIDADIYAGPTPLVAATRCYVASKLGDEVEVPDELRL